MIPKNFYYYEVSSVNHSDNTTSSGKTGRHQHSNNELEQASVDKKSQQEFQPDDKSASESSSKERRLVTKSSERVQMSARRQSPLTRSPRQRLFDAPPSNDSFESKGVGKYKDITIKNEGGEKDSRSHSNLASGSTVKERHDGETREHFKDERKRSSPESQQNFFQQRRSPAEKRRVLRREKMGGNKKRRTRSPEDHSDDERFVSRRDVNGEGYDRDDRIDSTAATEGDRRRICYSNAREVRREREGSTLYNREIIYSETQVRTQTYEEINRRVEDTWPAEVPYTSGILRENIDRREESNNTGDYTRHSNTGFNDGDRYYHDSTTSSEKDLWLRSKSDNRKQPEESWRHQDLRVERLTEQDKYSARDSSRLHKGQGYTSRLQTDEGYTSKLQEVGGHTVRSWSPVVAPPDNLPPDDGSSYGDLDFRSRSFRGHTAVDHYGDSLDNKSRERRRNYLGSKVVSFSNKKVLNHCKYIIIL